MNPRLALTLFVLTAMARSVTADYVTWNVVDLKGDPYSKTVVRFTPIRGWVADGTNTIVDVVRSATPSATGGGRTKVLGGVYKVTADGAPGSTLIAVPGDGGEYTLNQCAQFATNCPPFFFTNFFGRISERVKVSGEGVSIVTNNQGAWNEYISLVVTSSGGPTNGITAATATNIAVSITDATNAALQSVISTASNAVFSAIETPGRTNTVVDGSVGLELAQRIQDKLRANTNIFKILTFGDSIGGWDIGGPGTGIHQWIGRMYGHAGSAGRSVNIFGVGLELYAQSVGANPALVNQDAGTNWWSLWHKGTNGTIVRWSNANLPNGNTANNVGLYWVATPEGGDFAFQISTNGGAFSTVATCSGYAAGRVGRYTNFVLAVGDYRCQAATATDVTNTFLGAQIYNSSSNGIVGFYVFKGGANLSQMTNTPAAVWDGVITNYVPDLVIWNAAEVPDIGETLFEYHLTNSWLPWAQRNTNTVVWLTGAAFRGDSNDVMHAKENEILRRTALTYGCIFSDTRYDAQSWERSFSLGYMRGAISPGDIVHFTPAGASALGYAAVRKAGLLSSARPPGAVVATLPSYALTNLQPNIQIGASPGSGSLGIGLSNTLPGLLVDMSGTQKLRIGTPGAGYAAIYFGTNAGVADYAGYALLGDNRMTRLNARAGGEVGMAIGNTAVLYSTNATEVRVPGTIRAAAVEGSGTGLTNIPMAGVAGLSNSLYWLTNNTGGGTGAVSSVNGLTGAVTLDAAAVGAQPVLGFAPQPATANGTNWAAISTNVITDLRQEIADTTLDFVPQYGSANLTNLSPYSPNAFLSWTNWNPGDPDVVRMQPIIGGTVVAGGWIDFWKTTEEWHFGQAIHASELHGSVSAADLTGTIDVARLGSGTANSTTVLYGDNVWRAQSGGSSTAVMVLDCSTGLVSYALSDRVPHVLIKSNATYNADLVANGATNTISGSLVWIDAQPVGATNWIIKW